MATAAESRTFAPALVHGENPRHLRAKREKVGHRLQHQDLKFEPDAEA
jgi:hypothetical protein